MNSAAIQFFNIVNPGAVAGNASGLLGSQGLNGMFQSLLAQNGNQNGTTLQEGQAALLGQLTPNSAGVASTNITDIEGLLSTLPAASIQSAVQALGLAQTNLQSELQPLLQQISANSPALKPQIDGLLQQFNNPALPQDSNLQLDFIKDVQSFLESAEVNKAKEDNGILAALFAVLDGTAAQFKGLAEMNLEEFKAFKEAAFGDIAGFITQPKQVLGPDGRVREFLTGPSFLNPEQGNGATTILSEYRLSTPAKDLTASDDWMAAFVAAPQVQSQMVQATPATQAQNISVASFEEGGDLHGQRPVFSMGGSATNKAAAMIGQFQGGTTNTQGAAKSAAGATNTTHAQAGMLSFSLNDSALSAPLEDGEWFKSELSPYRAARAASSLLAERATAARTHTATHGITIAMNRMAHNAPMPGERNMTIHMDPPELGRVEVKMQFGADKTVKTHMIVEKPETLAMLQRDTSQLNRALNNLGLDTSDGSDLTFDLGQGHEFGDSQNRGNQQQAFMSNGGDVLEDTVTFIETSMDVFTDPITGLRHLSMVI